MPLGFGDSDPLLTLNGGGHFGPFRPGPGSRARPGGWNQPGRARWGTTPPGTIPLNRPTPFRPSGPGWSGRAANIARPGRGAIATWRSNMMQASVGTSAAINLAFGVAITYGNAITESARWGATTGHQEDYVGGWVAGKAQGKSRAIGMGVGELVGTAVGAFIPVPLAAPILGLVGSLIGEPIAAFTTRRSSYEKGRIASRNAAGAMAKRKVQFGRGFVDSQEAYTMRQMAVQEMSGSLLNARQYLGNEAFFLHQ